MSAEALAVIFHSAFLSFVKAVTYLPLLIALCALNTFLLILVPMFNTLYAFVAVSVCRLVLCLMSFK